MSYHIVHAQPLTRLGLDIKYKSQGCEATEKEGQSASILHLYCTCLSSRLLHYQQISRCSSSHSHPACFFGRAQEVGAWSLIPATPFPGSHRPPCWYFSRGWLTVLLHFCPFPPPPRCARKNKTGCISLGPLRTVGGKCVRILVKDILSDNSTPSRAFPCPCVLAQ